MILCMPLQTDQGLRALRSLIDRTKLSYRAAARLIGMDNSVVTDWYNGTKKPVSQKSLDNLEKLVLALEDYERQHSPKRSEDLVRVGIKLVRILERNSTDECLPNTHENMIEVMDWGTGSERYGFVIEDDAMDDDLRVGQTIIADDKIVVDPNHVCLVQTSDGERMVRFAFGSGSERMFRANDPQYPPYPASRVKVIGVVVEVITPLPGDDEQRNIYKRGMRRKK